MGELWKSLFSLGDINIFEVPYYPLFNGRINTMALFAKSPSEEKLTFRFLSEVNLLNEFPWEVCYCRGK